MEPAPRFSLDDYAALVDDLQAGVVVGSRRHGVLLCNRMAADLLGVPREQLMGARAADPLWHFVREDGSPMPPDEYPANRVHRTGQAIAGLVMGVDRPAPGDRVWTLVHATPRLGADGEIDYVVVTYKDITARKRAEEALRESESRYRALFDNSRDGLLIADPDTAVFLFANRTVGRLLGYEPEELVGRSLADIHPPASHEQVRRYFQDMRDGLRDVAPDVPCLRRDGTVVYLDVVSHGIEFGGRTCVLGRFLDLTDRERAERALRESDALQASEARYRSVVEDQTEIISRFAADGTFTFVNDVFCRFFGRTAAELVGSQWAPRAVPEDVPRIQEALRSQSPANPVVVIENRVVSGTGEMRWMQFVNRAFYAPDGTLLEVQSVGRDVTDRRRADEELARYRDHLEELAQQRAVELTQVEERYQRLVEASPDAIVIHAEGRVLLANPATATLFRAASVDDLAGRALLDFMPPQSREVAAGRLAQVYRDRVAAPRREQQVIAVDGTVVDVDIATVPVVDRGRPAALSVMRDITVQRRLEQQMRTSQKLESVGVLAGGIAHDFNNLLSAILGNISLARLEPPGSPEADERLVQAERSVGRAITLTRQLLTFSRGGAPVRHATHLRSTLVDTADFALRGSNVAFTCDVPADLWAADVDVGQVSQVIHNIVLNGQQAMPAGGTLWLQARNEEVDGAGPLDLPAGRYVRISIRDEGIGIAPEHLERIFDPYFTTKSLGSGLGLAVCHSIVRQHGGRIDVESTLRRGTTFHIHLPAATRPVAPAVVPATATPSEAGHRVLLMDDDPDLRDALSGVLRALGYRTDTAADGRLALDRYARALEAGARYDAVILDLTVPGGMGGRETAARLLELDPSARLIVSSGYSNDPVMADHAAYGFRDLLPKPCPVDRVAAVLRRVIAGPDAP